MPEYPRTGGGLIARSESLQEEPCLASHASGLLAGASAGQPLRSVVVASSPITGVSGFGFGLLGSDVLSKFGAVTIDYRDKTMPLADAPMRRPSASVLTGSRRGFPEVVELGRVVPAEPA